MAATGESLQAERFAAPKSERQREDEPRTVPRARRGFEDPPGFLDGERHDLLVLDPRCWAGYPVLREMRDLHTLATFIERASRGDAQATTEPPHRVATLMNGETTARWQAG